MKKFIMGLIVGIIIATTLTVGAASSINIFVNDKEINADKAFISEGTTMVPLRYWKHWSFVLNGTKKPGQFI